MTRIPALASAGKSAEPRAMRTQLEFLALATIVTCVIGCSSESSQPVTTTQARPLTTDSTNQITSPTTAGSASANAEHFTSVATLRSSGETPSEYRGNQHVVVTEWSGTVNKSYTSDGNLLGTYRETEPFESLSDCRDIKVTSTPSGTTTLYGLQAKELPAAGINPARYEYYITAWNKNFERSWQTLIASEPVSETTIYCFDGSTTYDSTADGKWITTTVAGKSAILDTTSGALRPLDFKPDTVGNFVVKQCMECSQPRRATVIDPQTLLPLAELSERPEINPLDTSGTNAIPPDPYDVLLIAIDRPEPTAPIDGGTKLAVVYQGGYYAAVLDLATATVQQAWSVEHSATGSSPPLVDDGGTTLIVRDHSDYTSRLRAFSLQTGAELWSVPNAGDLCAVSESQVAVTANDQMVLLDKLTGTQLDYTTSLSRCDHPFGKYTFNADGNVYKLVD